MIVNNKLITSQDLAKPLEGREIPPLITKGRCEQVALAFAEFGADALVTVNATNVGWCSGFWGSNGMLIVKPEGSLLITDERYAFQAPAQIQAAQAEVEVKIDNKALPALKDALGGTSAVAFEPELITYAQQRKIAESIEAEMIEAPGLIAQLRSIKTEAELARMEAAAAIVDMVFTECRERFVAGITERTIAQMLEDKMRAYGADGPAYETIVASGANSALPHAHPSDKELEDGDLLVIDAGATFEGYRSDMTRTFSIGQKPKGQAAEIYEIVAGAQTAGLNALRAGAVTGDIDKACRDFIKGAGYEKQFMHSTGHGVGLDIHEHPTLRKDDKGTLASGNVVTVEPGIYIEGFGGVRIEDMVVVDDDGFRSLTNYPKNI